MAKVDLQNPDKKLLREFGFTMAGAIGGIFGVLLPWLFDRAWPVWPWPIAALFFLAGVLFPLSMRHIFLAWMRFGHLLSKITTPLILGILFYLVITPVGLIRRMLGKNSMSGKEDRDSNSFRVPSEQPDDEHMERPF
jgi:hypothetical protein